VIFWYFVGDFLVFCWYFLVTWSKKDFWGFFGSDFMGKFCSDFASLAEIPGEGKKIAKKVYGKGTSEKKKKKGRRKCGVSNVC
jgi:hypothetical protein